MIDLGDIAVTYGWLINVVLRSLMAPAWGIAAYTFWRLRAAAFRQNGDDVLASALSLWIEIALTYTVFSVFLAVRSYLGNTGAWLWVSGWMIVPVATALVLFPVVVMAGSRRWLTRPLMLSRFVLYGVAGVMLAAGLWRVEHAVFPDVP